MDRREFLETVTYLSALTFLGGCGPEASSIPSASISGAPRAGSGFVPPSTRAEISGNHGHILIVPEADLSAESDKTYHIQGTADHDHEVLFSAKDLAVLAAGGTVVELTTLVQDHSHQITVRRL